MIVYLSGKISGLHINTAKNNFKHAENSFLHGRMSRVYPNCKIINPLEIKPLFGIKYWFFHVIADILKQRHCTHSAFQKNWIDSLGSVIEYVFAKFIFKQTIIFL